MRKTKKPYEKPAIIHKEKLETRAVACAKADGADPICGDPSMGGIVS